VEDDELDAVVAGTGAHAIDANSAATHASANLIDAIDLRNAPGKFNRRKSRWRLRFALLTDDLLQNLDSTRQIRSLHYERRKDAQSVLAGCQRQ